MKKFVVAAVLLALVAGCSDPNARTNSSLSSMSQTGRMRIVSAQYFTDAGGRAQDILVLRDSTTGREYLAVMGAGVMPMKDVKEQVAEIVEDALSD